MAYQIRLSQSAKHDITRLRVIDRRKVLDAIDRHLLYEPTKVSKSRIKRLRYMASPQYRLRVDEIRVYYDIVESTVEILAVIHKDFSNSWLAQEGIAET